MWKLPVECNRVVARVCCPPLNFLARLLNIVGIVYHLLVQTDMFRGAEQIHSDARTTKSTPCFGALPHPAPEVADKILKKGEHAVMKPGDVHCGGFCTFASAQMMHWRRATDPRLSQYLNIRECKRTLEKSNELTLISLVRWGKHQGPSYT